MKSWLTVQRGNNVIGDFTKNWSHLLVRSSHPGIYSPITQIQDDNVTTLNVEVQKECNSQRKCSFISSWKWSAECAMERTEPFQLSE